MRKTICDLFIILFIGFLFASVLSSGQLHWYGDVVRASPQFTPVSYAAMHWVSKDVVSYALLIRESSWFLLLVLLP